MNNDLKSFIEEAEKQNWPVEKIKEELLTAGWPLVDIENAFNKNKLIVPKPPNVTTIQTAPHLPHGPVAVVENLTPRGFEYKIFSVSLTLALFALIFMADVLLGGSTGAESALPLTLLIVAGPVALFLFMRLKRAEKSNPEIRYDPSRRKAIQAILLVSFLSIIGHTIFLLYMIISGHYSSASNPYNYDGAYASDKPSLARDIAHWAVTLVVAGAAFVYYWRDEHGSTSVDKII